MPTPPPERTIQRHLLALLEVSGPLTRAELAGLAGLPPTTVAGVVKELLRSGHLDEVVSESTPHRAGRPPRALALAGPLRVVAVVGLRDGGLRLTLATVAGEVLTDRSEAVATRRRDPGSLFAPTAAMLLATLRDAEVSRPRLMAVVLGVARPQAQIHSAAPLEERVGVPVIVENDANLGALGEAAFGAGRGLDSFVYVMLGHGVGAGLVFGSRLHRGASGFAGELAHVQVREPGDGPPCVCGGRGCLASVIGPSLSEFVGRAYAERLSVAQVLSLAADQEPGVRRVFADLGRTVGRPLADLCTILDPAAVVVDGSLGAAGPPVMTGIRETIDRHAAPAVADSIQVLTGELGELAEVLGGVALVRQRSLDAP
ncbi:MAG: ROK family transcriptional regulator [Candidatus Dormibacteria bacterium]